MASTMMDAKTESSVINWDNFPAGLRVMVVDDDELCLKLVETMLQKCSYEVTTFNNATEALEVLRRRTLEFDLVLSDVYMPDIDGFKLLETIGLELDLPVIMMSSNGETTTVLRGVTHGAVDFLIKPVRIEELRNLWQHVVRRRRDITGSEVKDVDSDEQSQDKEDQAESSKKRKDLSKDGRDSMRDDDGGAAKKPRVVWSVEMHQQFVNAVNQLGIDKAVPKKILELMNVEGLTRENVASHLQKYRLYLKRVAGVSGSSGRVKSIGPSIPSLTTTTPPPALATTQPALSHLPSLNPSPQTQPLPPPPSMNPDSMPNPFSNPGLLPSPQGGMGFQHPNLGNMSAVQAQAVAAQAANMMGAINAMNLGVAGAMNLSRLNSLGGGNSANAASMAMQLGMGGMSGQQLSAMGMGLNPGLGLSLPNMQNMGPMTMAQMGQLHLGMVGMGGMGGGMLGTNPLGPPNPHLHPPSADQPHSLLGGAHLFAPASAPAQQLQQQQQQQALRPAAASLAQELAMMESGAFPDFPASSAPMSVNNASSSDHQQAAALDPNEFSMFRDAFGAVHPATSGPMMMQTDNKEPLDDFLSFLLKDGNMQHDA